MKAYSCCGNQLIVDAGPDRTICLGNSTVLGGDPVVQACCSQANNFTYVWSPATGLDNPYIPHPTATPTETTTYTLTVTTQCCHCSCCTKTGSDSVTVYVDKVEADAGPDKQVCNGSVQIGGEPTAVSGIPPFSYLWNPESGLDDPTAANPFALPVATTAYTVLVSDSIGCSDTDEMIVETNCQGCAPRTIGYWKHECNTHQHEDPTQYYSLVSALSTIFDEFTASEDLCYYINRDPDPQDENKRLERALQQLSALWLNVASGKIYFSTPISLPPELTTATTIQGAIEEIEDIIWAAPTPSDPELDRAKDIADWLNNSCGYVEPCQEECNLPLFLKKSSNGELVLYWSNLLAPSYTVMRTSNPNMAGNIVCQTSYTYCIDAHPDSNIIFYILNY